MDSLACATAGGAAQGSGSTCATASCPECIEDEDCDDTLMCTIDRCDLISHVCGHIPYDSVCDDQVFCNGAEICDLAAGCIAGSPRCQSPTDCNETNDVCLTLIPGDFNHDGDVDRFDYTEFEACASGPAIARAANCGPADFDTDNDVDQADFSAFQRCVSGENMVGDPNCAD
jgi:hypothetical protein